MVTPDPSSSRASQPSPLAGRKATLFAPAASSARASWTTTRSAPPGPSDSIKCAIRIALTSPAE